MDKQVYVAITIRGYALATAIRLVTLMTEKGRLIEFRSVRGGIRVRGRLTMADVTAFMYGNPNDLGNVTIQL